MTSKESGGFEEEYVIGEAMAMFGNDGEEDLAKWSGQGEYKDKVLICPNWGSDGIFFGRKDLPGIRYDDTLCTWNHLQTAMQNAFYLPTSLSYKLHRKRKDQLFDAVDYGAIHIRAQFTGTEDSLFIEIAKCVKSVVSKHAEIQDWWIVTDNPPVVIKKMTRVLKFTQVRHAYDEEFNNINTKSNKHSNFDKEFAQRDMSGSIMDWMVLHESTVSIVVSGTYTAFGHTGARGNGKVSHNCINGVGTVYERPSSLVTNV